MKKRYILGSIALVIVCIPFLFEKPRTTPSKTIYISTAFADTQDAKKAFDKEAPIILWDLHDCLFEKPRFAWLRRGVWNINNKPKFAYELIKAQFNRHAKKAIQYQYDKPAYSPQPYFEPLRSYAHLYLELNRFVNNVYRPDKESFKVVKALHESDYKQYLFSNIGPVTLHMLQQEYPQYFSYFERLQNVINPVTPAQDQWIQKPDKKAFLKALSAVEMDKKPQFVIFIDDREDNIQLAQKYGMNGIVFISPDQLQKDLKTLIDI